MGLKRFALLFFLCGLASGQQPQSSTAPLFAVNAKYTNGVAPGYAPTKGSGLTLNLGPGTTDCLGTLIEYAGGTLTMTNGTTNYVYLDPGSSCAPTSSTSIFTSAHVWIAKVTASGGAITVIDDVRTSFLAPGTGSGSGTVTTSGSPAAHQPAIFSGATSITGATAGTADSIFMGNDAGTGADPAFKAGPSGGTNGCAGATDTLTYNTSTHAWGCHQITPGTGTTITIASGTADLGTSALASAKCYGDASQPAVVTVTATGTLTTDVVLASFNSDPHGVTGYIPLTTGMLTIIPYPTADHVNFIVCNNTGASITPGAIRLNYRVVR